MRVKGVGLYVAFAQDKRGGGTGYKGLSVHWGGEAAQRAFRVISPFYIVWKCHSAVCSAPLIHKAPPSTLTFPQSLVGEFLLM